MGENTAVYLVSGDGLKLYMKRHRLSAPAMGRLLGLTYRQINRYKSGQGDIPCATQIAIFALIHWKDPMFLALIKEFTGVAPGSGAP